MNHPRIARKEDAFLLVIDLQEPLLKVIQEPEALLKNATLLIETAKALHLPIFATEQYPERFGPTTESIRSIWSDFKAFGKMAFSCWENEELRSEIKKTGRRTAIVCGVETHVCVNQTAHDLLVSGYKVHVPTDAVSSRTSANKEAGLIKLRDSGAIVTTTEMVAYECFGRAGTPEFKALLPLFK